MIGAAIYTFHGMIKPILTQLLQTSWQVILGICLCCVIYELIEGWVTYSFAHKYDKNFQYRHGVESAFYACFYRVVTLGSGAGISVIYFLNEKGISYSSATGLYMMEYVLHKISIALLSVVLLAFNYDFLHSYISTHISLLFTGYGITLIISIGLILFCLSKTLHQKFLWILNFFNQKQKGKWTNKISAAKQYVQTLEDSSRMVFQDKMFAFGIIGKNFVKLLFWYGIPFLILYPYHFMSFWQVITLSSLSVMLAAVIPSPAGIGAIEFVMILLFAQITGQKMAVCVSILYRFATFLFPFLVGGLFILTRKIYLHFTQRNN